MRRLLHLSSPSFALISVLALVSLAALTATAFLASAKLERQATGSLSRTVQLEMALAAGEKCAEQTMADGIQPSGGPNFVTTLYRGPGPNDWTNEDGYLFIGIPNSARNLKWKYFAGFSPRTLTNLDTNVIESCIRWTNSQQGAFTSEISTFMNGATNGFSSDPAVAATSKICTLLPLLGGRTSLPVGWVYLYQDKRIFGTTNTTNVPVARVAWFMEDLTGKIDVERMGSLGTRDTGTNPEEISLANMLRLGGGNVLNDLTKITNSTNRKLFFTPGLLANSSLSGLTNTNDLRYFAAGLREWRPTNANGNNGTVSWIPAGIFSYVSNPTASKTPVGYKCSGYLKMDLNRVIATRDATNISNFIKDNLPDFTNRAGGMNGANYLLALAANMIDYADTDSSATSTNINGVNIVGFDNYPMLTHVFDQFLYDKDARSITITTYLQFWNPSSVSTLPLSGGTFTYNLNDTIRYPTNTTTPILYTNRPLTNAALANSSFNFGGAPFSFPANSGYITSITNTVDLTDAANFPKFLATGPASLGIDTIIGTDYDNAATNSFKLTGLGAINQPPILLHRWSSSPTLNSGTPKWIGSVLGLRMSSGVGNEASSRLSVDPRMLNYIGVGTAQQIAYNDYDTVYWRGYPSQFTTALLSGHPGNWPDGYNTANTPIPTRGTTNPPSLIGPFTITNAAGVTDPAPCKISNFGSYTNICELGNIFDPIQWAPPTTSTLTNYANVDIPTGANWTTNNLYGGGSTLRIGRPEHSRFAFTNLGSTPTSQPIPNTGQSAAALLDLFCISNP
ncbi:MAG: hypothetical protein NTU87_00410, partial [Verrucomicrobia bacterium]|nr:hypothetical protein [Verrucomicrobiota bacterium]